MLSTIGFVLMYGVLGLLAAVVWVFVIGFASAPGLAYSRMFAQGQDWHSGSAGNQLLAGVLICAAGQIYAALAFQVLVVSYCSAVLHERPDLIRWIVWLVAYTISVLPCQWIVKEAALKTEKSSADVAGVFTLIGSLAGFWVFLFFPGLMRPAWSLFVWG